MNIKEEAKPTCTVLSFPLGEAEFTRILTSSHSSYLIDSSM